MKKIYLLFVCLIPLCQASVIYSQGPRGGRGNTTPSNSSTKTSENRTIKKNVYEENIKRRDRYKKSGKGLTVKTRGVKTPNAPKPNTPKVSYTSLSISVSEPESEIFIADRNGNIFKDIESAFNDETGAPLVIDDVERGTYTLTIRKDGFIEEKKQITVRAGKTNSFKITLRPAMAFLTVSTNVDGANIEIENIGEFENRIDNYPLEPGNYRLRVYKNGYETETREVSLNAVGARQNLPINLRPFPIEKFLAEGQTAFGARDYEKSAGFARKILAAAPDNAKANRLLGDSLFNLPDPQDASVYLAKAVDGGEAVSIPVKIYNKEKGNLQLLPGNLIITKNDIKFQATNQAFSFRVASGNIKELYEKIDSFRLPHIGLKFNGIFNGKMVSRIVILYSQDAVSLGKKLSCPSCADDACFCQSKNTVTSQLLEKWRSGDFSSRP